MGVTQDQLVKVILLQRDDKPKDKEVKEPRGRQEALLVFKILNRLSTFQRVLRKYSTDLKTNLPVQSLPQLLRQRLTE